jgi:hypothetical protein
MLRPTTEVEVPTDLVRRLLPGQHLPHEELTEGDGAFPPASRPTAPIGMFVRLDHASLQASHLSRSDLASEAG